jgi:glycosyltransferase involved in cell wall biosynthesis
MLSILIPVYNYNVLPLVQKLHAQAMQANIAFEIIVVDDCSTIEQKDNYRINELEHYRFLENNSNLGRTLTRKKLAEAAKFDHLLFLDADVMPADDAFISNYITAINDEPVVIGGVSYKAESLQKNKELRFKYGICREQTTAEQRNKNPYGSVLSGNILVKKNVFLENNYSEKYNYYGMDVMFSYNLYKNNIPVKHINNPVYHLGLEDNSIFFEKSLEAVKNRKQLLGNEKDSGQINSLLRYYKTIKKLRATGVVKLMFRITEPVLKKMILNRNPNLFCLDIYRLGYICSLK